MRVRAFNEGVNTQARRFHYIITNSRVERFRHIKRGKGEHFLDVSSKPVGDTTHKTDTQGQKSIINKIIKCSEIKMKVF